MRIVHINSGATGGAALAAINLHTALLDNGIESHFLHLYPSSDPIPNTALYQPANIAERICNSILFKWQKKNDKKLQSLKPLGLNFNSLYSPYYFLHKHPLVKGADVVNLHWVAGFVNYPSFFRSINKPIVWTLHDENPFLGGFHYEYEYQFCQDGYINQREAILKKLKKASLEGMSVEVVGPSRWILEKAKGSAVMANKGYNLIPNGVDTDVFFPKNKYEARKKYGIPLDKFVVLFVADSIVDKRKGIDYLIKALIHLENMKEDVVLCSVGKGKLDLSTHSYFKFGYVSEKEKMAELYSIADLFIIPSVADNLPNTILESLSCGTPVLGFNVGGIPDMVIENKTGFLIEVANAKLLADKIVFAKENPDLLERMGSEAVLFCKSNFSLNSQAQKYIELYSSLLS